MVVTGTAPAHGRHGLEPALQLAQEELPVQWCSQGPWPSDKSCHSGGVALLWVHVTRAFINAACAQVLYTLPVDRSDPDSALIGESGAMNVFFVLDKVFPCLVAVWQQLFACKHIYTSWCFPDRGCPRLHPAHKLPA